MELYDYTLDICETPTTVRPQTFWKPIIFTNLPKTFEVYLWGNKIYFGDIVFTFEEIENDGILTFCFCLPWGFLTLWVGGSDRVVKKG